jgi:hypothetical protein
MCLVLLSSGLAPAETPPASQPTDGTSEADLRATIQLQRIRAAEAAYRAGVLIERAVRAEVRGADAQAEALYAEAVELEPGNERARLGLQATRDRLGLVTERRPLIERRQREARIRRQEILYRFNAAIEAATDGIVAGTPEGFQKARLAIDRARIARDSDPSVFSTGDLDDLDARLADHDLALQGAIQRRADAIERARAKERARRLRAARVNDIRLEL